MRKINFILILIFVFSKCLLSQTNWMWGNPHPQGNKLTDIQILDQNVVYTCGANGTIIKSTNSGVSWIVQFVSLYSDLYSISMINDLTGYTAGKSGIIYKTTNGGINWLNKSFGSANLYSIKFINKDTGYLTSYTNIFKTINGGNNWNIIFHKDSATFKKISFPDKNTGYVSGDGGMYAGFILKTTNAGNNWFYISQFTGIYEGNYVMDFINAATGFVGFTKWVYPSDIIGGVYKTTNGGNTFINTISKGGWRAFGVSLTDSSNGFALMDYYANPLQERTKIIKTTNGGNVWDTTGVITGNVVNDICSRGNTGLVCGVGGYLGYTNNSGINWQESSSGFYDQINQISCINTNTWILVSEEGNVIKTANSGLNWSITPLGVNSLYSIKMINANTGFIGSYNSIFKTTNFGINWLPIFTQPTIIISTFCFLNKDTGFAGGAQGLIIKTTNEGINWIKVDSTNNAAHYYGSYFINSLTGWMCGWNGYIVKTTNGGNNWFNLVHFPNNHVYDIFFTSIDTGFIAAQRSIQKTTNGGQNWITKYYVEQSSFKRILFTSKTKGYATGYDGTIMITTNAGENWWNSNWVTNNMSNSIIALDSNTLITGGAYGTVLKTTNGGMPIGVYNYSNQLPMESHFSQNYPNPFNPSTIIKFDIPKSSNVQIVVYDILGREIGQLLNEDKKPGSYEITWDGSGIASGIYFYKIISDEFIETKKMVLLK